MPHHRARHLESLLRKTLGYSGVVGLFGHRQVGKTTLATRFGDRYATLDDPLKLAQAQADAMDFLQNGIGRKTFVIDECQMAPALFPALKEWVRTRPAPGQFLLTGAVRFSSRRVIRESLTGRMIGWELLPMDMSEAHGRPLPNVVPRLLSAKNLEFPLEPSKYASETNLAKALDHGGLPGIFTIRDVAIRAQRFETMLQTLFERDLRLILDTTVSDSSLRNLLVILALNQTKPLALTDLARQSRISVPTLRKLLQAFEAMYVLRIIQTEGSERRPVLFFEDQGEATHLSSNRYDESTQMTRLLYSQLRHQMHYRPELRATLFQLRNRGGAYVPLCFRSGKSILGIIPILTENPQPQALATARGFFKAFPGSKLLYVHQGKSDRMIDARIRCLGVRYLI